jgi:hypothetical protein
LSQAICGKEIIHNFQPPAPYTGELLGAEYLYQQSSLSLAPATEDELNTQIEDEGFHETEECSGSPNCEDVDSLVAPMESESEEDESEDDRGNILCTIICYSLKTADPKILFTFYRTRKMLLPSMPLGKQGGIGWIAWQQHYYS